MNIWLYGLIALITLIGLVAADAWFDWDVEGDMWIGVMIACALWPISVPLLLVLLGLVFLHTRLKELREKRRTED